MKKIYMAGVGGMLGEAFFEQFKNEYDIKCTDIDLNTNWLEYLDFRDFQSYEKDVIHFNADFLFHIGAFTDLEYCEKNPDETYLTNILSVENAVNIANKLEIPLLFISTAGIFDGAQSTYDDWDHPNPLGIYARSKVISESYVKENSNKYLICRAGWMMGGGPNKDKKFVNKIITQIQSGEKELNIVDDKDGTPTYTHDFAKNTKLLLQKEYWGLYNMVCEGETSRLEVAKEIIKLLDMQNETKINKVKSNYFSDEYFAPRPNSERLINKKLNLRNLNIMRDWKVCLKEYIENYFNGA